MKTGYKKKQDSLFASSNPTIVGFFPPPEIRTGGHRRFLELMRGLAERGYEVNLLHNANVRGVDTPLPGRCIPLPISSGRGPAWWRYLRAVKNRRVELTETLATRPLVVVAFSTTDYFAAKALSRHLNAPLLFSFRSNIVTIHRRFGMLHKESRRFKHLQLLVQGIWKRFLEWRISCGADRIVFQSDFDRDEIVGRNSCADRRSVIIPNSIQASWFSPEHARTNRSDKVEKIIFLGSLGERKGIQYLIPAMRVLCNERRYRIRLDVVGFGGLEAWAKTYIEEHDLADCVRILGRDRRPLDRLAKSDLLVVPSLYDSFPNSVLEALYVGTPVIGTNTSGIKAILAAPELLFDSESTEAIVQALDDLIRDNSRYLHVKRRCAERRDTFDFDWIGRFEEVLRTFA